MLRRVFVLPRNVTTGLAIGAMSADKQVPRPRGQETPEGSIRWGRRYPMFSVPESWVDDHRLTLEELGFLVSLTGILERAAQTLSLDEIASQRGVTVAAVETFCGRLADLGYIVAGEVVDPLAPKQRVSLTKHVAVAPDPDPNVLRSVVYYIQRKSDQTIKIGVSRSLASRMRTLERFVGDIALLATEPGGTVTESKRHAEFSELRISGLPAWLGTEWFRPEPDLLRHIETLAGGR